MTLNLTVDAYSHTDFTPRITVIGVGGGGTNAVDNMIAAGLQGVDFVVANTDAQQLVHSRADRRVQLGPHLTQGLGAGAKPEIGRAAAQEAADEITRHLEGTHMVFITAGMGGGTGTGAAPVVAQLAREKGVLTVGVVTKPFNFEGARRAKAAEQGIAELQQYVDTLIVIPNQNLFRLANERTGWKEAFKMADQVLYMGVRGVTDLMMSPGQINLDFADIRTVMAEMGKAMMGTGEADGDNRAIRAAEAAISNPLLEDTSMSGARGLLINITGGDDMTLFEVDQAANRIREEVADDANIIFGSAIDENLSGRIRVSVVATGIDMARDAEALRPRLVAVGGGAPMLQHPVAAPGVLGAPVPVAMSVPLPTPMAPAAPSPVVSLTPSAPAPRPAEAPQVAQAAAPAVEAPVRTGPFVPSAPMVRPASAPRPSSIFSESAQPQPGQPSQAAYQAAPHQAPAPASSARSLFDMVTRGMRGRAAPAPQPAATTDQRQAAPRRPEPNFGDRGEATSDGAPQQNQTDETFEIPAFLRRQSS